MSKRNEELYKLRYPSQSVESIDDIRPQRIYSKSNFRQIKTRNGYALVDALNHHPKAPSMDYDAAKEGLGAGHLFKGQTIIDFYHLIESESMPQESAPWMRGADKSAERADIVARIMSKLHPHIERTVYEVLFEEGN